MARINGNVRISYDPSHFAFKPALYHYNVSVRTPDTTYEREVEIDGVKMVGTFTRKGETIFEGIVDSFCRAEATNGAITSTAQLQAKRFCDWAGIELPEQCTVDIRMTGNPETVVIDHKQALEIARRQK